MKTKRISKLKEAALVLAVLLGAAVWYVRANPRIFNESFFGHAHCIKQTGTALRLYANDQGGNYPVHTNGYGDALLLLDPEYISSFELITGPCFNSDVFRNAKASGTNVNEAECGRVYVQGLAEGMNQEIAQLFDKLPTPGDHSHGFSRLTRRFVREVLLLDGSHQIISTAKWPAFVTNQIKLLVEAGIPETVAKSYYENLPE